MQNFLKNNRMRKKNDLEEKQLNKQKKNVNGR